MLELRSHYIGGSDAAVQDKTIKNEIKKDMYEVQNETVFDAEYVDIDDETGETNFDELKEFVQQRVKEGWN